MLCLFNIYNILPSVYFRMGLIHESFTTTTSDISLLFPLHHDFFTIFTPFQTVVPWPCKLSEMKSIWMSLIM